MEARPSKLTLWLARIAVACVFAGNMQCAIVFLLNPEGYMGAYGLSGVAGAAAIQGIAVAFLMWNATYPLVIFDPYRFRVVFGIVLAQQLIGLVGESFILYGIGSGYEVLAGSILRFIAFDAAGLAVMSAAAIALFISARNHKAVVKIP